MGLDYNSNSKKWEILDDKHQPIIAIGDGVTIQDGTEVTLIKVITGTTPAIQVGTLDFAVATITGLGSLSTSDKVIVNPKSALTVGVSDVRVVAAGQVMLRFVNPKADTLLTQAAVGWDVLAVRS